ncbi:MAG: DUF624 domain-containing protein [Oscillospiraceae bacterium]|jgi:uncharacterized membrane protein YesL|nr:DUF624 domain-containing protein [Oscillospiraceae bacterium]
MPIFYNPQKSGRGVAKGGPEKKPFFKFFELFGRKFWKLILLNLVYIAFCVPVVTIGPATAALSHVMRKFVLEQPIFMFGEFVFAFKKNFKQSAAVGIADAAFILLFFNALFFFGAREDNVMLAMTMISGVIFTTMNLYIYPQIVCLQLKLPAIVKNSALLGIVGLKRNAVTVAVFIGIISLFAFMFPYSVIFIPIAPFSQLAFLSVFNAYPVIRKYIVDPYYESRGEKNPESPDCGESAEQPIFTDLGGKEAIVNKKKVKIEGRLIK